MKNKIIKFIVIMSFIITVPIIFTQPPENTIDQDTLEKEQLPYTLSPHEYYLVPLVNRFLDFIRSFYNYPEEEALDPDPYDDSPLLQPQTTKSDNKNSEATITVLNL